MNCTVSSREPRGPSRVPMCRAEGKGNEARDLDSFEELRVKFLTFRQLMIVKNLLA